MIYTAKLRAESPVFIGGREDRLDASQFVIKDGFCFHINEDKLLQELKKHQLHDSFCRSVIDSSGYFKMDRFLRKHSLYNRDIIEKITGYRSTWQVSGRKNYFQPFIRTADGRPYIPGSTIKGALKTAVGYYLLKKIAEKDERIFREKFGARVERAIEKVYNWKRYDDRIINFLFQDFALKTGPGQSPSSSQRDIFRMIKISDSVPLAPDSLEILPVAVVNITRGGFKEKASLVREFIPAGTELEFRLKIDEELFSYFRQPIPLNRIEVIEKSLEEFAAGIIEQELEFYNYSSSGLNSDRIKKYYREKGSEINLRIGSGTGITGTTFILLMDEELKLKLRNDVGKEKDIDIFPKTRKVIKDANSLIYPPGWCRLEII